METEAPKFKLLIWDFSRDAMEWVRDNMESSRFSIEKHMTEVEDMLSGTFTFPWDYILCFIPHRQEIKRKFDDIFTRLGISSDQVIYAQQLEDWVRHKDVAFYLLKGDRRDRMELYCEKEKKDYVTCTVDGITYIAGSSDRVILDWMVLSGRNWSDEEMQEFYRLSKKYYQIDATKRGYFIDIGANIGTTCIYFKKKMDDNVDILAFEPEKKNYKLLSANLLLNDLGKAAIAENYGLSEKSEQGTIHINNANPGGNSFLLDYGQETEEIPMISLDGYLSEKGISSGDIKYIWIDTEGFEPLVLSGAKDTLKNGSIPVFMEINPYLWNTAGLFEKMVEVLSELYTQYIVLDEISEEGEQLHPIEEIWQYREAPQFYQKDIFLIK